MPVAHPAEPPRSTLAVSIVVVAFCQREALLRCLDSCLVAAGRVIGGAELIVVDNGELSDLVRAHYPQAEIVKPGFNSGFAAAINRAAAVARGRWVAIVNDDAWLEPGALAAAVATGENDASIGSVAGQVRFAREPGRLNSAGLAVDRFGIAADRLVSAPVAECDESADVFGPTGCFALYRGTMLKQIGGFDERFFAYLEDADVAWRARAAGWSCRYEPSAVAYHEGSASSREGSAAKYFLVGRNRVWLLARNATWRQLLLGMPGIVLYDVAYVTYVALKDRTLAPLWGRLAGLCSFRARRRERRGQRHDVPLGPAGWLGALAMHRAYRSLGSSG